jgi:hypothetical protein
MMMDETQVYKESLTIARQNGEQEQYRESKRHNE